MTRGFSSEESAQIERKLLARGREFFSRYGLEKTTVAELAKAAGVGKGTFYRFFPSKEALFARVLIDELPRISAWLVSESFGKAADCRDGLTRYMKKIVELIETDELARAFVAVGGRQEQLLTAMELRSMGDEQRQGFLSPILQIIVEAQERGEIVPGDPLELTQVLGAIKLFPLYKDQFPSELYSRLVDRTAQVIADGLTCPARTEVR